MAMSDAPALSQNEIDQQQALLATYHRTLAHLIQQAAQYGGETSAPVSISNGIHEARRSIQHIKAALRTSGVSVNDGPNDEPPEAQLPLSSAPASLSTPTSQPVDTHSTISTGGGDYAEGNIDQRQGAFISGGTIYGPVVGYNKGTITTTYSAAASDMRSPGLLEQALEQVQ